MVMIEDIEAAAKRIAPAIVRTPLLHSDALDEAAGARVFVKAECLQRFGAFKMRGAYNCIAAFAPDVRARGVIAFSSGNHGIAVTGAARDFGVPATIVMPADAPLIKCDTIRALGGEIVFYDRLAEDREAIGASLARERGSALVKPFDDEFVIAGQGTIGLEIAQDVSADVVLTPASGGGLASGIAIALAGVSPKTRVYAVEPSGHDDIARSLASGATEHNAPGVRSICDALLVERPGDITLPLLRANIAGALAIEDEEALAAMAFAFRHLKIVLEPSGAAALAALLSGKLDVKGGTAVVIASGGNVDPGVFARVLAL
jgi:threonine dehydratase